MHFRSIFHHSGFFVTIISVFCSSALNGVCCKRDALVLKGYHNSKAFFGPALTNRYLCRGFKLYILYWIYMNAIGSNGASTILICSASFKLIVCKIVQTLGTRYS